MTTTRSRIIQYGAIILITATVGGGYWYWKNAQAAQTMNDNRPSFEAPLTHDLNLSAGQGIATYSRADGADRRATVTDFEGRIIPVKQNEARFEGARRVENLFSYSSDFSNAAWTVQLGATKIGTNQMSLTSTSGSGFYQQMAAVIPDNNGRTFRYSIDVQWVSGDTSYQMGGYSNVGFSVSPTTVITVSSEWKRFSILATTHASTDATNLSFNLIRTTNGGVINVRNAQLEEVTGQANQNPSEYVSTNVKTAFPYHGAGVDGVKYFDTENGNTMASNVVTEATGAKIASSTLHGYLAEGSRTNKLAYSEQFGSWTSDDGSVSADVAVAPDGQSTADKFVSNTNTAQHRVKQTSSLVAGATYTGTVYVKKAGYDYHMKIWSVSGSATMSVNLDTGGVINTGGGEYVGSSITALPNGWYRVSLTMTTVSGGTYTQMNYLYNNAESFAGDGTSGIYLWGAQLESGNFASSYIPTTTATVTRAKDSLSYPSSGNTETTQGTATSEIYGSNKDLSTAFDRILSIDDGSSNTNTITLLFNGNVGSDQGKAYSGGSSGGVSQTAAGATTGTKLTSPALLKVGTSWIAGRHTFFDSGVLRDAKTGFTVPVMFTDIHIGASSTLATQAFGSVKNVRIWKKALSDTELQNLTSTTEGIATSAVKKTTITGTPDNTGLVGYWSFEDGSGTKAEDFSPTGVNTGTLTNGPTWVDGKIGKAVNFDGTDDYVSFGDVLDVGAGDMSVSVWVKAANSSNGRVVNKFYSGDLDGWIFDINETTNGINSPGLVRFRMNDTNGNNFDYAVDGNIDDNEWHLIGFSLDRDSTDGFKLFVDGVQIGTSVDPTSVSGSLDNSVDLALGVIPTATGGYMTGLLDEVRIYDYALSAVEIAGLYAQGSTGKTTVNTSENNELTSGLVGLWSFNGPDLSGTTAYDRSGQGNNGTLTNGPTVYPGKVGQGLKFDGTSNYVSVPHAAIFEPGGSQWTVSAWVRVSSDGTILCKSANEPSACDFNADHYGLRVVSGKASFSFSNGDFINIATGTSSVTDGDWHFIVGTRSASKTADIYVDGAFEATFTGTGVNGGIEVSVPLYIGSDDAAVSDGLGGYIDEVRIYNRALSTAEISALYQMGK